MLECYHADLHIHTCLSPCADLTMSPKRIVERAREKKLDMIGICDHNSAENVLATQRAAHGNGITVLPGMEVASVEEVHVLALFDTTEKALDFQSIVYEHLAPGENNERLFGEQLIVNENDEVEGYNKRLLIGATSLPIEAIVREIHNFHGLAIASHIDRESYSIIGQLGFIPPTLQLDAVEISPHMSIANAKSKFSKMISIPMITASDAHFLEEVGKAPMQFMIEDPTVDEIGRALRNEAGRRICLEL